MNILDKKFFGFIGFKKIPKAPWNKFYQKKHMNINVLNESIYQYLKRHIINFKNNIAIEYYGTTITYHEFLEKIDICSKAFQKEGVRRGDVVSIISANIPEALISFYALNKIGAVVNFLHPMLSINEIKDILNAYSVPYVVAMDIVLTKLNKILDDVHVNRVIVISAKDFMPIPIKIAYEITQGRKIKRPHHPIYISWKDFILAGKNSASEENSINVKKDTPAIIMQSGGSTGTPKGIVLSNGNINAASIQAKIALPDLNYEDIILGIMPIFHGFGFQVSINDAFNIGAKVVLIPQFKASHFDQLIKKYKPSVLVGVPTLFMALTNNEGMKNVHLEQLKYVIAGGDSFSKEKVKKINQFLHQHGAKTNFTQGYGMTEAVAAISFDLKYATREGTVGIPWPGTYVKIVKPGTEEELHYGLDGEICITGPTVMLGYYDNIKETNDALRIHSDGNLWLHSGDLGSMDQDGFISFKGRIKRMIVTSGYNVYPSQVEEVIERHPAVMDASVIGIPHPYKMEVVKAFIALKKGHKETPFLREDLLQLCKNNLANYAIPKEFEFRQSLPKTIVGKVDFRKLQMENRKIRRDEYEKNK